MKDDPKYQKYLIKEYNHWKLFVHQDQSVLGRVYLWCKREDANDFIEMNEKERAEFFDAVKEVKNALQNLFQPDLFNYAALQNVTNHLHVHIYPRYQERRVFESKEFNDKHWGAPHRSEDAEEIPEEILMTIKDTLKNRLQSQ